jgi:ketosteroid isomerase-like protein
MSQEKVEVVESLLEAFNRRDFAAAVEHLHPAVEVRPAVVGLDTAGPGSSRLLRGRGEVRGFFEELGATWVSQRVEFQEIIEAPGDRVLAHELWHTEGRDGIRVDFEIVDVYMVRDRLIVRVEGFLDRADALAAVGLSE